LIKNFANGIDLISFRLSQLVVKPRTELRSEFISSI